MFQTIKGLGIYQRVLAQLRPPAEHPRLLRQELLEVLKQLVTVQELVRVPLAEVQELGLAPVLGSVLVPVVVVPPQVLQPVRPPTWKRVFIQNELSSSIFII